MAIARKCDICGGLYEEYNIEQDKDHPNCLKFMSADRNNQVWSYSRIDCCPKCMEAIHETMDKLKEGTYGC